MTRVAFVYTHFPHYREAVFRHLRDNSVLETRLFYDQEREAAGIKAGKSETNDIHLHTRTLGRILFQWGFLRYALAGQFDVYVFLGNPYIATTWIYALIARFRGRRVYFWTHGWISSREAGAKARLRDAFYRLAHGLLLYGDRARSLGIGRGFRESSLVPIYNSLDYDRQRQVRRVRDPDYSNPYFLCVSRVVMAARIDLAIEAVAILAGRGYHSRLVVVGTGPLRADLEMRARAARVAVEFTGAIYDEATVACLMARCIAVISPGKVGLLAMHALAYGVPVITHDDLDYQMPEVEALRPDVTGMFFTRDEPSSLADTMELALLPQGTEDTYHAAIAEIEARWNPQVQTRLIEKALSSSSRRHA